MTEQTARLKLTHAKTVFVNVSDRLYPARLGLSMHQIKTSWFRQLLTDMDGKQKTPPFPFSLPLPFSRGVAPRQTS